MPPFLGSDTPWHGKSSPSALKGSLTAVASIGTGDEMNKWPDATPVMSNRKALVNDKEEIKFIVMDVP